jgi:4-diphosphocytidyl-2-C-methyl-D-erythritol kinase
MSSLVRESPAKINLTLRVVGRRPDGYHDIESLVAQVDLCDTVGVSPREDRRFLVDCDEPSIPCDHSNLAWRAARALADETGERRGATISLRKRIPSGAGLGGGSSNAATTLKLLNAHWGLRLSHPELACIGARLGSDVPLFCHGPLCVIRGRGEHVEELRQRVAKWVALLLPRLHSATPVVYAAWDRLESRSAPCGLEQVITGLSAPAADVMPQLHNDLEAAAFAVLPELRTLAEHAAAATGLGVRMTGSGSTLYRLFDQEAPARAFAEAVTAASHVRTVVAPLRLS